GEAIDDDRQKKRRDERDRQHDRAATRKCRQLEATSQPAHIGTEFLDCAHGSSRRVPRYPLPTRDSASARTSNREIAYHQRPLCSVPDGATVRPPAGVAPAAGATAGAWAGGPSVLPRHSARTSGGIGVRSDSRRSALAATRSWRPLARRTS